MRVLCVVCVHCFAGKKRGVVVILGLFVKDQGETQVRERESDTSLD